MTKQLFRIQFQITLNQFLSTIHANEASELNSVFNFYIFIYLFIFIYGINWSKRRGAIRISFSFNVAIDEITDLFEFIINWTD